MHQTISSALILLKARLYWWVRVRSLSLFLDMPISATSTLKTDFHPFQAPALHAARLRDFSPSVNLQHLFDKYHKQIPSDAPLQDQLAYAFTLHYASVGLQQSPEEAVHTFKTSLHTSGLFSATSIPGAVGVSYLTVAGRITHAMFATSVPSTASKGKRLRWRQQRIDQACTALGRPWIEPMLPVDGSKYAPMGNCQEELSLLGLLDAFKWASQSHSWSKAALYVYTESTGSAEPKKACWKCKQVLQNAAVLYGILVVDVGDECRTYPVI